MIGLISLTDQLIEEVEILEGTVTIEEINAAAKTLAPKMQSSFGK